MAKKKNESYGDNKLLMGLLILAIAVSVLGVALNFVYWGVSP